MIIGNTAKARLVPEPFGCITPVLSDRKCTKCGLYWLKNHTFGAHGERRHVGYYHRCGASESGKFDGNGEFLRVDLQMNPDPW